LVGVSSLGGAVDADGSDSEVSESVSGVRRRAGGCRFRCGLPFVGLTFGILQQSKNVEQYMCLERDDNWW